MDKYKNAIIALLTGLLVLSLSTQSSNGAVNTYDAVKLAEYQTCLSQTNIEKWTGNGSTFERFLEECLKYKPKKQ